MKLDSRLGLVSTISNIAALISVDKPFIIVIDTTKAGLSNSFQFNIPTLETGVYNATIDWGDGTSDLITTWNDPKLTHTYATEGEYQIAISGVFEGFSFGDTGSLDNQKLLQILQFGNKFKVGSGGYYFTCPFLNYINFVGANFSYLIDARYMFNGAARCASYDLSNLNFSNVIDAVGMFQTYKFEPPQSFNLTNTDFSSLIDATSMFNGNFCEVLDLSTIKLPKLENASRLLYVSPVLSEVILPSNLPEVTNLSASMKGCSSLTTISFVGLNYPKLTRMDNMFEECSSLVELDISGATMPLVQLMQYMLYGCTNLEEFKFPPSIAPINLRGVFRGCIKPLSLPNLPTLDVSNVTDMDEFLMNSYIPTATYSSALEYWATLTLQEDVVCDMGSSKYNSAGESAKNYIVSTFNWTFNDGGLEV
jgi:hypothetical protein